MLRAVECDEPGCSDAPVVLLAVFRRDRNIGVSFACERHRFRRAATIRVTLGAEPEAAAAIPVQHKQLIRDSDVKAALTQDYLRRAGEML